MKHKHHDLIVEWAADTSKVVQIKNGDRWIDLAGVPSWDKNFEYRFKPIPKPDVTFDVLVEQKNAYPEIRWPEHWEMANMEFTFDGETGKLKKARMIR